MLLALLAWMDARLAKGLRAMREVGESASPRENRAHHMPQQRRKAALGAWVTLREIKSAFSSISPKMLTSPLAHGPGVARPRIPPRNGGAFARRNDMTVTVNYWVGTTEQSGKAKTYAQAMKLADRNQNAFSPSFYDEDGKQLYDTGYGLAYEDQPDLLAM